MVKHTQFVGVDDTPVIKVHTVAMVHIKAIAFKVEDLELQEIRKYKLVLIQSLDTLEQRFAIVVDLVSFCFYFKIIIILFLINY